MHAVFIVYLHLIYYFAELLVFVRYVTKFNVF